MDFEPVKSEQQNTIDDQVMAYKELKIITSYNLNKNKEIIDNITKLEKSM